MEIQIWDLAYNSTLDKHAAAAIYGKLTPEELLWAATLDAARALGLEVPVQLLQRADELIE